MTQRAHFQISADHELGHTARCRARAKQVDALMGQDIFKEACKGVGTPPTRRQARKWLNRSGRAYKHSREAANA